MKYCLIFRGVWVNLDKVFEAQNSKHRLANNYQIPMTKILIPSPLVGEG
jgi:hypothetical protein